VVPAGVVLPRLIYREIRSDFGDARAWIPNNLICRDPGAISCLLGYVSVRYSLRVRDQRASRSFLSLSLSSTGIPFSYRHPRWRADLLDDRW